MEDDAHPVTHDCWFFNISLGGIGLECDRDNLVNATINVVYKVGTQLRKDRLQIKYSIKCISKWRYGGQFLHEDNARNTLISHFIEKKYNSNA